MAQYWQSLASAMQQKGQHPSSLSRASLSLNFILEGVSSSQTIIFLPTEQNILLMENKNKKKTTQPFASPPPRMLYNIYSHISFTLRYHQL